VTSAKRIPTKWTNAICIWKYFILFSVLIRCKSFPIHLVKMTRPLLVRGHYNINCFLIYTWWY
jgi:hypothetical protein